MKRTAPQVAALYDGANPDGPDHDYFRALADRGSSEVIVDLGCGTGILTVSLVSDGRSVIGLDPDQGMLDVARVRPGGGEVRWVLGDSRHLEPGVDLILMTGNVIQHIVPAEWSRTLAEVSAALRAGGRVAFESRNPVVRSWRRWKRQLTTRTRRTDTGLLTEWLEASEPDEHGTVTLTTSHCWDGGEEFLATQPLTFRSAEIIRRDLAMAGLVIDDVRGGWNNEQFDEQESELIVVEAHRS